MFLETPHLFPFFVIQMISSFNFSAVYMKIKKKHLQNTSWILFKK